MFTGIIEQIGTIEKIEGNRFTIRHTFEEPFEIGESVAVNGVCLTVVEARENYKSQASNSKKETQAFCVEIIQESRNVTTFGSAKEGDLVNLERAARIGQRNSGHNVTGHVDQVGTILALEKKEDYWRFRIGIDPQFKRLIVRKGSVAVEGISLTVSGVGDDFFEVCIIPHTWEKTVLHTKVLGGGVNVEFDIYAKYLERNTHG